MTNPPLHDRKATHMRRLAMVIIAVSAVMVGIGASATTLRASAVLQEVASSGLPGHLVLRADPGSPEWKELQAGDAVHWLIEASLQDAARSTLTVELRADGRLVDAGEMTAAVSACSTAFAVSDPLDVVGAPAPVCTGDATAVLATTPLSSVASANEGTVFDLAELRRGTPRHLLVTLALAPTADPARYAGTSARFGVGLHAMGDTAPDSDEALPATGSASDLLPLALLAAGLVGLGIGIVLRRRTPATSGNEDAS